MAGPCQSSSGQTSRCMSPAVYKHMCACVCMCACLTPALCEAGEDSCSSISQQVSDQLTVTVHLFVYNQRPQQLVWTQSAVTQSSQHHERSLPRACPPSLGVVTAGPAEHLFKVTTLPKLSTFFSAHKHFFKSPESYSPRGRQ